MQDVLAVAQISRLAAVCIDEPDMHSCYAVQFILSFNVGLIEVANGDWILISSGDTTVVGLVYEIAEFFCSGVSKLRMLLKEDRIVARLDESRGGVITIPHADPTVSPDGLLINIEECTIREVHCVSVNESYIFTYM